MSVIEINVDGHGPESISATGRPDLGPSVIYEFQIEGAEGDWASLGLARTAAVVPEIEAAASALRANRGGNLRPGSYRVRILERKPRWWYAEVDVDGTFSLIDRPLDRS